MGKEQTGKLKRFGGRWIREGEQYRERYRGLKAVFSRFWYLLVPFLGYMWAQDTYIRPVEEDVKSLKNRETAALLDSQDDIRAQVSTVQSQTHDVESEMDTLYVPQIEFYGNIQDSLKTLRLVYDANLPQAKARVDSLTLLRDGLVTELDQLSETLRDRLATLRDLRAWRATMEDSILQLDSLIAFKTDDLYRKENPLDYRRKNALITGQGEYPRRDENPTRERGR